MSVSDLVSDYVKEVYECVCVSACACVCFIFTIQLSFPCPFLFLLRYFYQTFRSHWNSVSFPRISTYFYRNIRALCIHVCVCVSVCSAANKLLTIAKWAASQA